MAFPSPKNILIVRFANLYASYGKRVREITGKVALPEDTLLLYMKEQPYYVGLVGVTHWSDKRTSGYAFDYDLMQEMGIVLEKNSLGSDDKTSPETLPARPAPVPEQGELGYPKAWDN